MSEQGRAVPALGVQASAPVVPEIAAVEPDDSVEPEGLTERDLAVLDVERQCWSHPGAKEEAIRTRLGLSAARYYQLLAALIDSPQALAADPMLVKRLQRMRQARSEARVRRSLGTTPSSPLPARPPAPSAHRGPNQTDDAE